MDDFWKQSANVFDNTINFRTREERERDASYTRASILMVLVFVVCHTPRLITNTLELFVDQADLPLVSSFQSWKQVMDIHIQ